MGVMDFLFGTPDQTGQLDPQTKAARDFLLNQMLMQYSAGPVNVPQYQAVAPSAMYSGTNALLGSLGLEGVSAPSMPTTQVGGMDVYTSAPFQQSMETAYAEQYPGQYDYLRSFYMDPVTGEFGSRSYGYADPMTAAAEAAAAASQSGGSAPMTSAPMTDEEVVMSQTGRGGFSLMDNLRADEIGTPISFDAPSSTGSYGGSLVTGRPSKASQDVFKAAKAGSKSGGAEKTFGSDLSRSLTDSSYDPPGTVFSRAIDRMFGRG
jgi:hypothetical protein